MTDRTSALLDTANAALANFDGDVGVTTIGQTILLDQGVAAVLSDPQNELIFLEASIALPTATDHLGIKTDGTGIALSDLLNVGSEIRLDGAATAIGTVIQGGSPSSIRIQFNATATTEDMQRLVQAITYTSTANTDAVVRKQIGIEFDGLHLNREIYSNVDIVVGPAGT